jgi:1-acyl-sn-glycerol-3-phosphate acyltransferase
MLLWCFGRSIFQRIAGRGSLEDRALWLHESALLVIKHMGIRLTIEGEPPAQGLLVANHLSYLDILTFGAAAPCFLVSKVQIGGWPLFGRLARAGGTIFVDRSSRRSAESVTEQIAERLKGNVPVLFFPEGTSTDGSRILRFHSRFYTPAVSAGIPVTAAAVRYIPEDGSPESDVCWFGDAPFLPHLWKVLGGPNFSAEIRFGAAKTHADRRSAANETFAEIEGFREQSVPVLQ